MTRRAEAAPDPLRKARLTFRQHGVGVHLEVLEGVFAGAAVDAGTRHLLRWLAAEEFTASRTVLDLGCGYGPLALWLAAAGADRHVLAVDRDARALEATALGAEANGFADRVEVAGSLGYDELGDRRVDLVVANLPAKVGPAALAHLVLDAHHHLTAEGTMAVVVVDRLAGAVADLLADAAVEVLSTHPSRAYTAFLYRFTGAPAGSSGIGGFERGVYRRARDRFRAGDLAWEADVSFSIGEFDSLGHGTVAALELAGPRDGAVLVDGVGQGHLALALRAAGHRGQLRLADRDLLALRTAAANLEASGPPTGAVRHRARPVPGDIEDTDLAVIALPGREPVAVTAALLGHGLGGHRGEVVLHGRSADLGRVLELLPRSGLRLETLGRSRRGAHGAVLARVAPRATRRRR